MPGAEVAIGVAGAVMGAVALVQGLIPGTSEGFRLQSDEASYPKELKDFIREGTLVSRDVIRFKADGYVWDTDLAVGMRGAFSQNDDELVCYGDVPGVPSNRFMTDVGFFKSASSDTVSNNTLDVTITGLESPEEPPEDPKLVFHVSGHFDPAGVGDERFSFYLHVDTYGQIHTTERQCSGRLQITDRGDYVEVYLNQ